MLKTLFVSLAICVIIRLSISIFNKTLKFLNMFESRKESFVGWLILVVSSLIIYCLMDIIL
ncbi:hypothetical protein [Clostridioides difficile]|uniref:Uncharacterized protein n=1 Tax=Clostridioides difficile TaxID=1496 RepID=A0A9X8RLJ6_CLODI|nr:hypothetical protein [Clostridioides difficile]MDC0804709.1 hypothetical protein [Clostridium paraputrificum]AWH83423.1 hypothetical protein DDG63_20530 [Clostridioides difficile]EGT3659721.1 hypothetical protein [Clostridioides difficile]EGT4145747.1 hypothetical protein [Clostridioides difficile]EGT4846758.1 hypothetical protein [Clostridioides difficile]